LFLLITLIHAGDKGELVDRLFVDDYRQYAPPFVDSITIPKRMLEQLAQTSQLLFTLDIPPGIGMVCVFPHSCFLSLLLLLLPVH